MARSTKATAPAVDELVDELAEATPEAVEPATVEPLDDDQVDGLDALPESGNDDDQVDAGVDELDAVDDEPDVPEDVTGRTIWPGSL